MRPLRWSLPVLLLACLVTACSTPTVDAPPTTQTDAPSATRLPRVVLPPRPRDIDLTGIDTCTLLTEPQRQELGIDQPWVRNDFVSQFYDGQPVNDCTTRRTARPALELGVLISRRSGIEVWTTSEVNGTVTPTSVSGFPAVQAVPMSQARYCTFAVDVGPDEVVALNFSDGGSEPPITQPELCTRGKQVMEMIMKTIITFGR